jgi:ubiquinone biosynthesis protein UbiJ
MGPIELGPAAFAPALLNRALEHEAWAQASLAAHAGRTFAIAVGPLTTRLRIDGAGRVEAAPRDGSHADVTLALSPLSVPAFLANPKRWDELIVADGDEALAATLKGLAETLPWFVERAFAAVLGPIVGQRVADAGRSLLAFPEYAASQVGDSVASYAREEIRFAASNVDARALGKDIATLAQQVDALAARVEAFAARLEPREPRTASLRTPRKPHAA